MGEDSELPSAAVSVSRDEQAGSERGARWWKPQSAAGMMVLAVVVLLGVVDGGVRAHFGLRTILGEELSMGAPWGGEHGHSTMSIDASAMSPVGHGRHLLMQVQEGADCKVSFNCVSGLVCREGVCSVCGNDDECVVRNTKDQCQKSNDGHNTCKHKPLFHPFDHSDLAISIITLITIILAAPAGVGGGGILVPMYLAIGKFSPHYGIPLSKATIFGGAVTNNMFNVSRRHPEANRPLIDYNACMMLEPVLLLGTILGVFFNAVAPGWLITILLVCTLTWTTWRTTIKAKQTYDKEVAAEADAERQSLLPAGSKSTLRHSSFLEADSFPPELREIMVNESKVNWTSIGVLCISWIVIAVFSILKGGEGGAGIVPCGTFFYWCLVLAPLPIVVGTVWHIGNVLSAQYELKLKYGFEFADGDLQWTKRNTRVYPLYCISAGFCAGALGIAAGTILGPVLLELGMLPLSGTVSSGFMVIFTASSTTFQFLVMGQLQIDYAVFFCSVGLVGGAIGNTIVTYFVKKYNKTWFVVAILSAVLAVSTVLMGYAGYERLQSSEAHGKSLGLRPLCPMVLHPNLGGSSKPVTNRQVQAVAQAAIKKSPLISPKVGAK